MAELEPERRFDLVLLVHVLEHVNDPVSLLRQAGERLRNGGILYVDVPDVGAHAGIQDLHLAHCNHFSHHTLGATLTRGGLDALRIVPHRPPTLPPSLFAVARRLEEGSAVEPVEPDPAGEEHARRVAAIDVGRVSYWRRRLKEHLAHRS
jgi:SAM-dependent methyltransferase